MKLKWNNYIIFYLFHFIDTEGCFQSFVAILHSSGCDSADEEKVINTLVNSLSAGENSAVVLRVFVSVFNLLCSTSSKFQVLKGNIIVH